MLVTPLFTMIVLMEVRYSAQGWGELEKSPISPLPLMVSVPEVLIDHVTDEEPEGPQLPLVAPRNAPERGRRPMAQSRPAAPSPTRTSSCN